jgi:hypothetical protein
LVSKQFVLGTGRVFQFTQYYNDYGDSKMNERIQELAEQAYEQQPLMVVNSQTYEPEHKIGNGGVPMYHKVFNQEKFAQLIIQECMHMCEVAQWGCITHGWDKQAQGCQSVQEYIAEHFGIEE